MATQKNGENVTSLEGYLIVCFYHVTYRFESESTLYSCLNVKELLEAGAISED